MKVKIQILLIVAVLGNALPIHAMMVQRTKIRRLPGKKPLTTQPIQPSTPTPVNIPTLQLQGPSHTWLGDKVSALKTAITSYWYGSNRPVQAQQVQPIIFESIKQQQISLEPKIAVRLLGLKSDNEIREDIIKKLDTNNPWDDSTIIEQIKILLGRDNPNLFFYTNCSCSNTFED